MTTSEYAAAFLSSASRRRKRLGGCGRRRSSSACSSSTAYVPIVNAFAASFERVAPGAFVAPEPGLAFALALARTFVDAALLVAAPAIASAAVVQIALAAVARVVPRFASFSLAFPVMFAVALIAALVAIPPLVPLAARPWIVSPFGAP